MIFVQSGEAYTDRACQKKQGKAPKSVDVEGKRHSHSQTEIFSHVGSFAHVVIYFSA